MPADRRLIERIFQEACDLPPEQRAPFVAARCRDDETLRREVETLLRHELDAPDDFLRGAPGTPDGLDEVGPSIGPYAVVRRIGEGGFGSVYLGRQDAPIRRQVAIKVVKLGMDTRRIVRRFEAERQTLALMAHPNIARAIDAGVTPRGQPYFVMEYVPGPPITDYCDAQRLPIPARLALFLDVCAAVEHAHHKGVIHRDIKPSNILVDTVDGHPIVKVIDFGIAKALGPAPDRTLTQDGHLLGTPDYASPEQADPAADVDTRSDIYSLGVLLYQLLSGALPAERHSPSTRLRAAGDRAAPVAAHRSTDRRALARRLRGDLDWITLRAIDPDRERRYSSCSELAADLRRHLAGEPVVACPPSTVYRLRKFVARHRAAVAGAALAALLLAVSVPAIAWQAFRATRAEAVAGIERDAARLEARRAGAAIEFLQDMLREATPREGGSSTLTVREALDRAAQRLDDGDLADHPEVEDAVRWVLGRTYRSLGRNASAAMQFEWIAGFRERARGPGAPATADALVEMAGAYMTSGRPDQARTILERAAEVYRVAGRGVHSEELCFLLLGEIGFRHGDAPRAVEILTALTTRLERSGGMENPDLGWAYFRLAQAQERAGRREECLASFERALPLIERDYEPLAVNRVIFERTYCVHVLLDGGRPREAAARLGALLEAIRAPFGPGHASTLSTQLELGRALIEAGQPAEAEPVLRDHMAACAAALPPTAVEGFLSRSLLGHALDALGRDAEAEPLLLSALEEVERHHPDRRDLRAPVLERVIAFYERRGRDAAAFRARRDPPGRTYDRP